MIIGTVGEQLPPGAYSIVWRVAGRDGHGVHGTIPFSIAQPAVIMTDTAKSALPPDEHFEVSSVSVVGAIGFVLVRWAAYIALFLMVGAVVFRQVILPKAADEGDTFATIASTNAATLGLASSAILIVTALLKLARESADMPDTSFVSMMSGSTWAMSVTAQIIAGIVAIVAFMRAHRQDAARWWSVASAAAVVAAIAPAFGGHAISHEHAHLAVPADIVHILAGASWLGTLAVLVLCGITAAVKSPDDVPASQRVARLVNAFSPLALMCGGVVVATGLGSAFLRLDSVDALWTTAYGSALFRKLIFVLLLFGTGAWNWRRIRPHLAEESMLPRLNRSATVELVLAALVLGFTAFLVALEV